MVSIKPNRFLRYCLLTQSQDSLRNRRRAVPASLNMKNTERFYPPVAVAQRPASATTDFFDTEFEMSDSEDDESPRMSMDSVCLFRIVLM